MTTMKARLRCQVYVGSRSNGETRSRGNYSRWRNGEEAWLIFVQTYGDARGGTLIEINLDIYSRQSAGYIGHCTSINAPTYLQLQPGIGEDITFELIIHDRGIAAARCSIFVSAFTCRESIRKNRTADVIYRSRERERESERGKKLARHVMSQRNKNLSKSSPIPSHFVAI